MICAFVNFFLISGKDLVTLSGECVKALSLLFDRSDQDRIV